MRNWRFFPLYGLTISDDTSGLNDPLFGDATLLSRDAMLTLSRDKTLNAEAADILAGKPMTQVLGPEKLSNLNVPLELAIDYQPHSFIAVRREKKEDGEDYARRICSFLTACLYLRSRTAASFAMRPDVLTWALVPKGIRTNAAGQLESTIQVVSNDRVLKKPITVSKDDLRQSWNKGRSLQVTFKPGETKNWDISKELPISPICLGKKNNAERLSNAALHLLNANCVREPNLQVQMAVSAMEIMFGTNEFGALKRMFETFLPGSQQKSDLHDLLKARHTFVHQGAFLSESDATRLAFKGLVLGYTLLDFLSGYATVTSKWKEWLAVYVQGLDVASKLEEIESEFALHGTNVRRAVGLYHPQLSGAGMTVSRSQAEPEPPATDRPADATTVPRLSASRPNEAIVDVAESMPQ